MRNSSIEVAPVAGAVGAEISGVDLATPLPDGTIAEIRAALNRHGVVFFRDQTLDAEQHKALARRFGRIFIHPNFRGAGDPEVVVIRREPEDKSVVGEEWHADTTMMPAPPMGAILYGEDIPPFGGDTLFACQAAAYDALSPTMQRMIEGLRAVHSDIRVAGPQAGKNAQRATKVREDSEWRETVSLHPVVRTHPENGRKMLFVNHSYTLAIEGLAPAESRALLDFLLDHGHRPEFTCRFRWQRGSVAFWDNRAVKHLALNDTRGYRRLMRRVQVEGDVPV